MKYLGIDYGKRRVGVAISDLTGRMAFPKTILSNDDQLIDTIATLIEDEAVETIVIGQSLDYNDNDNPIMERIRLFAAAIKQRTNKEVVFQDERLTTAEARYTLMQKGDVDAAAATLILQAYLDSHD